MITRVKTINQIKVFDIIARGDGSGAYKTDRMIWAQEQPWNSDEECAKLLEDAYKEWAEEKEANPRGVTDNKPVLRVYWTETGEYEDDDIYEKECGDYA